MEEGGQHGGAIAYCVVCVVVVVNDLRILSCVVVNDLLVPQATYY